MAEGIEAELADLRRRSREMGSVTLVNAVLIELDPHAWMRGSFHTYLYGILYERAGRHRSFAELAHHVTIAPEPACGRIAIYVGPIEELRRERYGAVPYATLVEGWGKEQIDQALQLVAVALGSADELALHMYLRVAGPAAEWNAIIR